MLSGIKCGKLWGFEIVLGFFGALVLLLVIAPLLSIVISTPGGELLETAKDAQVIDSISLTLKAAFFATIVSAVGGIPLAYLLARKRFPCRSILLAIIDLPIIIPHSAAGIALFGLIGRNSALSKITGLKFVGTTAGISIAMAFVSIPFLINAAREAFEAVDIKLEKAARTLGADKWRVFFTISLPLAWKGILSGMILMWSRGISEFGAVVIIAYHPMTTPVMVFKRFNDFGLSHSRAIAVLLIIVCVTLFVFLRVFSSRIAGKGDIDA